MSFESQQAARMAQHQAAIQEEAASQLSQLLISGQGNLSDAKWKATVEYARSPQAARDIAHEATSAREEKIVSGAPAKAWVSSTT